MIRRPGHRLPGPVERDLERGRRWSWPTPFSQAPAEPLLKRLECGLGGLESLIYLSPDPIHVLDVVPVAFLVAEITGAVGIEEVARAGVVGLPSRSEDRAAVIRMLLDAVTPLAESVGVVACERVRPDHGEIPQLSPA